MDYLDHYKQTVSLSVPVVLSQLGHIAVTVADSAMVGRTGTVPLAAAAFAGSTFYAVLLFGIGISYAITPLVSAALVKSKTERVGELLKNSLIIYPIAGICLTLLLILVSRFYDSFGQEAEVAEAAVPYLVLLAVSIIPMMIFQVFRQFLEGLSQTRQSMVISLITNVLNIVLNYLLIFGEFGFPELGLVGAGIATLIARIIAAAMIAVYVFKAAAYQKYVKAFKQVVVEIRVIKELLSLGLPSGLQLVFEVTAFGFSAIMVGWIGKDALAAHQIALNISAVTYMIYTGISAAAAIRVGTFFGKEDQVNQRKAGFTSMGLVMITIVISGILIVIFKDALPLLYTSDENVLSITSSIFIIVAIYQIGDGLQVVGLGALRGLTDVKIPTIVTLISYWLIALTLGYFLAFKFDFGIYGVWTGLLAGLSIAGFLHCARFYKIS